MHQVIFQALTSACKKKIDLNRYVLLGLPLSIGYLCFVHPIFSSFGFWYFGHFSCMIFFPVFFHLAHLDLQNVNKDYVTFSYLRNFDTKNDQKPKTINGTNETIVKFIPSDVDWAAIH